jgi:hypothetical protein
VDRTRRTVGPAECSRPPPTPTGGPAAVGPPRDPSSAKKPAATRSSSKAGGIVVGLWNRGELAADDAGGWGGITLAQNLGSSEAVDALLAEVAAADGTVHRPGSPTDWGGYSGLFADVDGHRWEIAHNPFWRATDDGSQFSLDGVQCSIPP